MGLGRWDEALQTWEIGDLTVGTTGSTRKVVLIAVPVLKQWRVPGRVGSVVSLDGDTSARGMREGKAAVGGGRAERAVRRVRREGAAGRRLMLEDKRRLMGFLPVVRIVLAVIARNLLQMRCCKEMGCVACYMR